MHDINPARSKGHGRRTASSAHLERHLQAESFPSFAGYETLETVPSLFVLMGNFHSYNCTATSTDYAAVRNNFASLALLLTRHTRIVVGRLPPLVAMTSPTLGSHRKFPPSKRPSSYPLILTPHPSSEFIQDISAQGSPDPHVTVWGSLG